LTFFGVTSEKIAFVTKKHTGTVKLLTALLFLALAVILFLLHYPPTHPPPSRGEGEGGGGRGRKRRERR